MPDEIKLKGMFMQDTFCIFLTTPSSHVIIVFIDDKILHSICM